MRLALYQPDIPQNVGGLMRLGACLGIAVDVIGPLGFLWEDKRLRRAGMDYRELTSVTRYDSWQSFLDLRPPGRLVLLTTKGAVAHHAFAFAPDDVLLLGRESAGVPDEVHAAADARLVIPLKPGLRSLNVAQAAAMVLGEALRQTGLFPQAA